MSIAIHTQELTVYRRAAVISTLLKLPTLHVHPINTTTGDFSYFVLIRKYQPSLVDGM